MKIQTSKLDQSIIQQAKIKIESIQRQLNKKSFGCTDHFLQLLLEIRYYIIPNVDLITEKYRSWFVPDRNQSISFDNVPLMIPHPQIALSYQYNKESIVLKIYQQLTVMLQDLVGFISNE